MNIINLTPHAVTVDPGGTDEITLPATGVFARIRELKGDLTQITVNGTRVALQQVSYADEVEGLAPPTDDVLYLVSRVTAAAATNRSDLVFPQDEVRDQHGQIIGCRALGTFAHLDDVEEV